MQKYEGSVTWVAIVLMAASIVFLLLGWRIPAVVLSFFVIAGIAVAIMAAPAHDWLVAHRKKELSGL